MKRKEQKSNKTEMKTWSENKKENLFMRLENRKVHTHIFYTHTYKHMEVDEFCENSRYLRQIYLNYRLDPNKY